MQEPFMDLFKATGPGTELKKLLQSLGIPNAWCEGCKGRAKQMDAWGVEGCRQHLDTIAGWLKEAADKQSAAVKLQAAWQAVLTGTWVNPLDPYRSLAERAIAAAEQQQANSQATSPPQS
jgi:hypothetical protein